MDALQTLEDVGANAGRPAQFPWQYAPAGRSEISVQRLPFTVRVVRHEQQLRKAIAIRQRAYERHLPALGELLREPEAQDRDPGHAGTTATRSTSMRASGTTSAATWTAVLAGGSSGV